MINAIRKTFFLVEGGKAAAAAQDAKFDGFNNVLVCARTAFEARVITEAYTDEQIGIDNVEADNGKDVISAVFAPSEDTLNEWIANYGKTILADDLLEVVADKGCVEVTAGVYLQTSEKILAEWPANPQFARARFWITYGECPLFSCPVNDAETPELVELVAENAEEIAKIIEAHRTDGIVLCEVDPSSMTFTVVEGAQPQPKKIEPTIIYHHEHPWAVVKTRDGEHSLQVSLTGLSYSEDGKPYLLAWQDTEQGPQELHLYLL